jgi:hypothetical protein
MNITICPLWLLLVVPIVSATEEFWRTAPNSIVNHKKDTCSGALENLSRREKEGKCGQANCPVMIPNRYLTFYCKDCDATSRA